MVGLIVCIICFLFRGINEEEVVLKTNKQVYSLLLRATANKSMTLLERIEVILNLLEQLAQNSEASNGGIQWLKCYKTAETVPCYAWDHWWGFPCDILYLLKVRISPTLLYCTSGKEQEFLFILWELCNGSVTSISLFEMPNWGSGYKCYHFLCWRNSRFFSYR